MGISQFDERGQMIIIYESHNEIQGIVNQEIVSAFSRALNAPQRMMKENIHATERAVPVILQIPSNRIHELTAAIQENLEGYHNQAVLLYTTDRRTEIQYYAVYANDDCYAAFQEALSHLQSIDWHDTGIM